MSFVGDCEDTESFLKTKNKCCNLNHFPGILKLPLKNKNLDNVENICKQPKSTKGTTRISKQINKLTDWLIDGQTDGQTDNINGRRRKTISLKVSQAQEGNNKQTSSWIAF